MGIIRLKYYDSVNLLRRKQIFSEYQKAFSKFEWAETPLFKTNHKETSYHLYLLRIKGISEKLRDAIIEDIYQNNVSVNVHFQPLPLLTAYKNLFYKIEDYPVSFDNYERVISLPVYQDLNKKDLKTVIDVVINAIEKFISNK
jgi:dTDP-4-amino-4,6-dideoxygalactose transaminase